MKEQILRLRAEGRTYTDIQSILNCSKSTISYHCSNGQKEKLRKRTNKYRGSKCVCGQSKIKTSKLCETCLFQNKRDLVLSKTLKDYTDIKTKRYPSVHRFARKIMRENNIPSECVVCGFSHYVEVCHLKPISEFDKSSKIGEINDISNLVYMCPNHHKMYDLKLLDIKDMVCKH